MLIDAAMLIGLSPAAMGFALGCLSSESAPLETWVVTERQYPNDADRTALVRNSIGPSRARKIKSRQIGPAATPKRNTRLKTPMALRRCEVPPARVINPGRPRF
jgi:hypothetical protein